MAPDGSFTMEVFPVPRTAQIYPISAPTRPRTIHYLGRWQSSVPKKAASTAKRACGRYGSNCLLQSTRMLSKTRAPMRRSLRLPWARARAAVQLSPLRAHDRCGRRTRGNSWAGASPRDTLDGRSLKSMPRIRKPVSLSLAT
jgi:hypothetical protein